MLEHLVLKFYLQVEEWFLKKHDHSTYKEEKKKFGEKQVPGKPNLK
jgi:hypothetical protein